MTKFPDAVYASQLEAEIARVEAEGPPFEDAELQAFKCTEFNDLEDKYLLVWSSQAVTVKLYED